MKDKFAYYDFIANIIPGIICLWLLQFYKITILDSNNIVAESILYIVVAYVVGLAIQFFAKYLIEFLVKLIFWENDFFSSVCLLKGSKQISEDLRKSVIEKVKTKFNMQESTLTALNDKFTFGFIGRLKYLNKNYREKVKKAHKISGLIYRKIDAYTKDNNMALKAHEQNNYYSLFRGLSMVFLSFLGVTIVIAMLQKTMDAKSIYLMVGSAVGFIIFLIRTKERGELYIKGLFYSITSEK